MKNILFRCDSSSSIGLGHVKRCLLLAKRLKQKCEKLNIFFATLNLEGNINQEILESGFSINTLNDNSINTLNYFIKTLEIDFLIIDSYEIDNFFEEELKFRNLNLKILSFDDTGKAHNSDIILNHGIQVKKSFYKNLVSNDTKILCGSKYTLLRDEFFEKYKTKIKNNAVAIILGGNDILNLSLKIINLLFEINKNYKITVITSKTNPNIKELLECEKIEVLIDIPNIAKVLSSREFIITGSGGTLFEVMALKKKFINIEIASNQEIVTHFLEGKNIKTTIKANELSLRSLKEKLEYIVTINIYKNLNLEFSKDRLLNKILKELI